MRIQRHTLDDYIVDEVRKYPDMFDYVKADEKHSDQVPKTFLEYLKRIGYTLRHPIDT